MSASLDWFKAVLGNWKTIVSIMMTLASLLGFQTWNVGAMEEAGNKKVHEVAAAFQSTMVVAEVAEVPVVVEACGWCKEEIIKLKRWH